MGASACSDPGLARSHIYDDGGPSPTIPAPASTIPATPTTPELAYYRIDGARIGGLKQKLIAALEPPPTIASRPGQSLSIALNLDAAGVAAANAGTLIPRCVAGLAIGNDGNGCMMPLSDAQGSRTRLFNYSPLQESLSLFNPVFDSRIRQGFESVGPLAPFLPINGTAEPALFEHPRIGLGPSIDLLADFMPLVDATATAPGDRVAKNTGIDLRFSPSEILYGSPAGAPRAGLYMPIDLTFTGGEWKQSHYCTRSLDGDASICPEIRENLDIEDLGSCENAYFAVRLNRIRMWLGLVPSIIPGCVDPMGKSTADDTVNGWMKRLPFSEPYRQGCLRVTTDIRVEVDDSAIALASSADAAFAATTPIALWADASACTDDVDILCSFADCPAIIREGARKTVAAKLRRQLPESLGPHVARYLTSNGGEFRNGTPPFCSLLVGRLPKTSGRRRAANR